jgi:hypothetical protein
MNMAATPGTRWFLRFGAIALAGLLAACTAPSPQGAPDPVAAPAPVAQPTPATPPRGAPSLGTPATKPGPRTAPVALDRSCRTDADCAVKDVGNCCGYFPACVNTNSPTDPAAVKAQCEASGMASVCGFQEISACTCTAGKCEAAGGGAPVAQ